MPHSKPPSVHESLLSKALEQFHSELGNADSTFTDVGSPEELLAQARALKPLSRDATNGPLSMFRLETILSHINDFAAIVALSSGAGTHVASVVWGSLKIVLMLAGAANDTFDDILTMLDYDSKIPWMLW